MGGRRRFRALSLDLWFTTFYHTAEDAHGWDRSRATVVRELLQRPGGRPCAEEEVEAAVREVRAQLEADGFASVTTGPSVVLRAVSERLGAEIIGPLDAAARSMAAAGLRTYPPRGNPDAEDLVRSLDHRGIPSVLVTNSSRPSTVWTEFLRARGGPPFRGVISSCDVGSAKPDPTIFREAARRVGVAPEQLLHVGDRYELDVVGALAAGCGAALYRGLWDQYPEEVYGPMPAPPAEMPEVTVLDRLETLREPALWDV